VNFRQVVGQCRKWIDIGERFSNFVFVDENYYSHSVLRRLFSLARKHQYSSLLIDEIKENECQLLAQENASLSLRCPDFKGSIVHRLSFLKCSTSEYPKPDDLIGYVIFKQDLFSGDPKPFQHIFEAVILPPRNTTDNNFIHSMKTYAVTTSLGIFSIQGILYAQQNGKTTVCAHVALRTVLACMLPGGDIGYDKINNLAGIDHKEKQVGGGKGLGPEQIERILSGLNISFKKIVVNEPDKNIELPTEYEPSLYGFIESGCPALLGFESQDSGTPHPPRHIIPVIGHTFNEDTWVPSAQRMYFNKDFGYFSSERWLSSYVVHDDNVGPYFCLPRHYLAKERIRLLIGLQQASSNIDAVEAEAVGLDYVTELCNTFPRGVGYWFDRFQVFGQCSMLVLRTMLITRSNYENHLRQITSKEGNHLEDSICTAFIKNLPDRFFMVEVSTQELFPVSRRKFGEIIVSADTVLPDPLDGSLLLGARLPNLLLFKEELTSNTPIIRKTALDGHTPLYAL
jgi:hypothetical protein